MPWKAKSPMDLRIEMMRLGAGERTTDLCREYGISRKTGNKFKERFDAVRILATSPFDAVVSRRTGLL